MSAGIEFFHQLLQQGVESNATDWHVKEGTGVSLRINGDMVPLDFTPDHAFMEELLWTLSTEDQRKAYEKTGDLDVSYAPDGIGRFRVNIHRQRALHAMTLRYVKSRIPNLSELSLPPVLRKIAEYKQGIIIVCGVTGSGKSTTLAAILDHINRHFPKHIITIEDPIEYEFQDDVSMFEQREVGLDTCSFQSALSHALRQDPDVIMVGEMRDRESFESALQASDTGHLVLSTLHATNASQAIARILDFYPRQEQDALRKSLALNLQAVVAQRLLPKISGGLVPAVEIMINTPNVRKLIQKNEMERLPDAIAAGREDGMISFNASLLDRINNGDITEEVGLEASEEPDVLRMNLKGIFVGTGSSILGE